jgi:hypothetical protein
MAMGASGSLGWMFVANEQSPSLDDDAGMATPAIPSARRNEWKIARNMANSKAGTALPNEPARQVGRQAGRGRGKPERLSRQPRTPSLTTDLIISQDSQALS